MKFLETNSNKHLILSSLFGFVSSGATLVIAGGICSFYLVLLIYKFVNNKKIKIKYIIPFAFVFLGVIINILSPGNFSRHSIIEGSSKISLFSLLFGCLKLVVKRYLNFITNQYLISGMVIVIFLLLKSKSDKKLNINPLVMLLLPILIPYIILFPFLFGYSSLTYFAHRVYFIVDTCIALITIVYLMYITLWVKQKYPIEVNLRKSRLIVFAALLTNLILVNPVNTPYFQMIKELSDGTLIKSYNTNKVIFKKLQNSDSKDYVITDQFITTNTYMKNYINEDPNFWVNISIAEYYNKNTITYKPNK